MDLDDESGRFYIHMGQFGRGIYYMLDCQLSHPCLGVHFLWPLSYDASGYIDKHTVHHHVLS